MQVTQFRKTYKMSPTHQSTEHRAEVLQSTRHKNRSLQLRSSEPIAQHGTKETKPNTTKPVTNQ